MRALLLFSIRMPEGYGARIRLLLAASMWKLEAGPLSVFWSSGLHVLVGSCQHMPRRSVPCSGHIAWEGGCELSEGAMFTWCRPTEQGRKEAALPAFRACTKHAGPSEARGHQKAPEPEQGLQGRMVRRQGHGQVSSYRCPLVPEGWGPVRHAVMTSIR